MNTPTVNYYFDQEFIEGFKKPWFGRRRHFIDLISIGMVASDGRRYKAICSEYNYDDATPWVRDNVIHPLYLSTVSGDARNFIDEKSFQKAYGLTRKAIAEEIKVFTRGTIPVFYGYYADYDWVLFCSLFGTMMDLPSGWPMYCRDLKQIKDEIIEKAVHQPAFFGFKKGTTKEEAEKWIGTMEPVNKKEHDAVSDAEWNMQLHESLTRLNQYFNLQHDAELLSRD